MSMFNLFKKPHVIEDAFFGKLRYIGSKDASKGYFEGKGFFMPTNNEIEYLIEADITGPTDRHRIFYQELQDNFKDYIERIRPLIEDEFRNWKEDFRIEDFSKEFTLVCLTIPRPGKTPLTWDMAFTTIHDANHHVTIDFIGNNPDGILIDG